MPVAPTSPRCWSSEDDFSQVPLPHPAPPSPPHSPSARGSLRAHMSHMLLCAAQFATIALHGAQEHLARALAQLELLYIIISGSIARIARRRPSFRLPRDQAESARRCLGAPFLRTWTRKYVCRRFFQVLSLLNSSIRNGRSHGRARERDPARVVSDFVIRCSSDAAGARGARGDGIRSRCRLRSSARGSGDCPIIV